MIDTLFNKVGLDDHSLAAQATLDAVLSRQTLMNGDGPQAAFQALHERVYQWPSKIAGKKHTVKG